jgi:hypothetical protein
MLNWGKLELTLSRLLFVRWFVVMTVMTCFVRPDLGAETRSNPSKVKAFLFSFVLPGAGEYYAGSRKTAAVFFGTECALWAVFSGFQTYGRWKQRDYRLFAASHAGVNPEGKNRDYFVAIENYMNIIAYNDAKLQQRRVDKLYPERQAFNWQWDSEVSRKRYKGMRIKSDLAYRNSLFVVGGIVLNHLVSGIDAVRVAGRNSNALKREVRVGLSGLPEGGGMVFFMKRF